MLSKSTTAFALNTRANLFVNSTGKPMIQAQKRFVNTYSKTMSMGLNKTPQNTTFVPAMRMSTHTIKGSTAPQPAFKHTNEMSSLSMKLNQSSIVGKNLLKMQAAPIFGNSSKIASKQAFSTMLNRPTQSS